MLTKNQTSTFIYIIDMMKEWPLKNEFLYQLNDLTQKDEESWKKKIQPVDMKEIYIKFKIKSDKFFKRINVSLIK